MKTINMYLDDLKEKTGSDYKTAKLLNIDNSVLSNIRKRNALSDINAIKVAIALEIDEGEVLLAATIARSEGAVKNAWERVGKKAGMTAVIGIVAVLGGVTIDQDLITVIFNEYTLCEVMYRAK
jgi:hypothetical protein